VLDHLLALDGYPDVVIGFEIAATSAHIACEAVYQIVPML
jgi:hypothetical protein